MRVTWGKRIITAAAAGLLTISLTCAQQSTEEGKRKIKSKTTPQYTDLARRMGLNGKVRIELVIAPDGHVKSSRAVGGHPVLVQSCLEAVRDWRFESAPEETTQIIEFEFKQQ